LRGLDLNQRVSAFAEFERDRIGERIRATKRAQKARGEYLGGVLPFGWAYGDGRTLVPDLAQQQAIRDMRELRGQGLSLRGVAERMHADGFRISHVAIARILQEKHGQCTS
jgi:DNA invertase Pin-like site-specific DNA recombinase